MTTSVLIKCISLHNVITKSCPNVMYKVTISPGHLGGKGLPEEDWMEEKLAGRFMAGSLWQGLWRLGRFGRGWLGEVKKGEVNG